MKTRRQAALAVAFLALAASGAAQCRPPPSGLDVCVALDESSSISDAETRLAKVFAARLYDNVDENTTRVAVVAFATGTRSVVSIAASFEEGRWTLLYDDLYRRAAGGTDILSGMDACASQMAPLDDGREKLLVLVSDGQCCGYDALVTASGALKNQSVLVATVGVTHGPVPPLDARSGPGGSTPDEAALRAMASKNGDGEDLFFVFSVDALANEATAATMMAGICAPGGGDPTDEPEPEGEPSPDGTDSRGPDGDELGADVEPGGDKEGGGGISKGAIAGIALGCIALLLVVASAAVLGKRRLAENDLRRRGAGPGAGGDVVIKLGELPGESTVLAYHAATVVVGETAGSGAAAAVAEGAAAAAAARAARSEGSGRPT
jgi:von Willebrand factor type A domain